MASNKYKSIEELNLQLVTNHTFTEKEYMNGDPSSLRPIILEFIGKLTHLSPNKIEKKLLIILAREMASEARSVTTHVRNRLDGVIAGQMESDAIKLDDRDGFIIEFSFPISTVFPLVESTDVTAIVAIFLYLWGKKFPPDMKYMKKSEQLTKRYEEATKFYDSGKIEIPSNMPPVPSNIDASETMASISDLKQQLADLKVTMSEYSDANTVNLDAKFKALSSIYVSIKRQDVMMNAVKEAKDAKVGLKEQKEATAKVITDISEKLADIMKRAEEFAKYKALDNYFETKSRNHYIQFGVWLALFICSLIGICVCFVVFYDKIEPLLPHITANNFNLGSSVLIIATTLMVAWILRVFIRLAMLNLQLAEDASNRTVLIRTLAALESQNGGLPKEQKIIAYNAIFRASLSDNSSLDVAQPTLGDLSGLFKGK